MSAATASDLERYMLDLVNEERISRGLNALVLDKVHQNVLTQLLR